jgi:hypothetical protein
MMAKCSTPYNAQILVPLGLQFTNLFLYGAQFQTVDGPSWGALYDKVMENQRQGQSYYPMLHGYWDYYNNYTSLLMFQPQTSFIWFREQMADTANIPRGRQRRRVEPPQTGVLDSVPSWQNWYGAILKRGSTRWADIKRQLQDKQGVVGGMTNPQKKDVVPNQVLSWWMTPFTDYTGFLWYGESFPLSLLESPEISRGHLVWILEMMLENVFEEIVTASPRWLVMDGLCILLDHEKVQNALRDNFEDPQSRLYIFVIVPSMIQDQDEAFVIIVTGDTLRTVNATQSVSCMTALKRFVLKERAQGRAYTANVDIKHKDFPRRRDALLCTALGFLGFFSVYDIGAKKYVNSDNTYDLVTEDCNQNRRLLTNFTCWAMRKLRRLPQLYKKLVVRHVATKLEGEGEGKGYGDGNEAGNEAEAEAEAEAGDSNGDNNAGVDEYARMSETAHRISQSAEDPLVLQPVTEVPAYLVVGVFNVVVRAVYGSDIFNTFAWETRFNVKVS